MKPMTDHELRIRVAELCGWIDCENRKGQGIWYGRRPPMFRSLWSVLPDYPNDLNDMHEAIEAMPHNKLEQLPYNLGLVLFGKHTNANDWIIHVMIHATARQLAEAFVMTMEGT